MTLTDTATARLVLTTVDSEAEARRLAKLLVEAQLAACVAIAPMYAVYRWEGAVAGAEEWQLTIKTDAERLPGLATCLQQEHRYEVPELLVLPVLAGAAGYLDWLRASLAPLPAGI